MLVQHQKELEIWTRVFGSEHVNEAASYLGIKRVYAEMGDLETAIIQSQKAHEVFLAVHHGQEDVADSYGQHGP